MKYIGSFYNCFETTLPSCFVIEQVGKAFQKSLKGYLKIAGLSLT